MAEQPHWNTGYTPQLTFFNGELYVQYDLHPDEEYRRSLQEQQRQQQAAVQSLMEGHATQAKVARLRQRQEIVRQLCLERRNWEVAGPGRRQHLNGRLQLMERMNGIRSSLPSSSSGGESLHVVVSHLYNPGCDLLQLQGEEPKPKTTTTTATTFDLILKEPKVMETLLSFLSLETMKALSTVSKEFLKAVRESKQFLNRVRLAVTKEVLEGGALHLNQNNFTWRNMALEIYPRIPFGLTVPLWPALERVESLKLRLEMGGLGDTLTILYRLLDVVGVAGSLRTLEIDVVRSAPEEVFNLEAEADDDKRDIYFDAGMIAGALRQIRCELSTSTPQLKKLLFRMELHPDPVPSQLNLFQIILAIVELNNETLEELELPIQFWELEGTKKAFCPGLNRLKIVTSPQAQVTTIQLHSLFDFLDLHPALEELDMTLRASLTYRILQLSQLFQLRKLHLKVEGVIGPIPSPMNWDVLETTPKLEDFSLVLDESMDTTELLWYGSAEGILRSLPPTTEKITLEGVEYFWSRRDRDGDSTPPQNDVGTLLSRFRKLKELNLKRCRSLRSAAVPEGPTSLALAGDSLHQLTQLAHLKIEHCPFVSAADVVHLVKSDSLRTLTYRDGNQTLRKSFLFRIVEQNPQLETIQLSPFTFNCDCEHYHPNREYLCVRAVREEVERINPNVKVLELDVCEMRITLHLNNDA